MTPSFSPVLKVPKVTIMSVPFDAFPVTTQKAMDAYGDMLKSGGASLPRRDSITNFLAASVLNKTGKTPGTTNDWPLGGYPIYKPAKPLTDSDHDGMPDVWEKRYSLNPRDPSDARKDKDGDGYTNIEEFINGTNPAKQ
jgi:hypothetical protein